VAEPSLELPPFGPGLVCGLRLWPFVLFGAVAEVSELDVLGFGEASGVGEASGLGLASGCGALGLEP
jgi:hypothetical protein